MTEASGTSATEEWLIEPRSKGVLARLPEIWQYRRLVRYFGKRAIERLYRNTLLGRAWLLIRPLFPLAIRALVFGGLLGVQTPGVPYFLFLLVGTSVWDLFASCLMWATRSLQINRTFVTRMYFPRIIVPAATTAPAFLNFVIMICVMVVCLAYYYVQDGRLYLNEPVHLPWAAGAIVLAFLLALAIGLFTSVANTEYRDVRFTIAYILEFWALLTPILYPLSAVPTDYQWIVFLNPMAGIVQAFKWGVLGTEPIDPIVFAVDAAVVLVVLLCGLWFFGKAEGYAVDRI